MRLHLQNFRGWARGSCLMMRHITNRWIVPIMGTPDLLCHDTLVTGEKLAGLPY